MVAIPVTGLSAVALVGNSMNPTVPEQLSVDLGRTQARLTMVNPPDPSLVQSPLEPGWWQVDSDETGTPVNAVDGAAIRDPADILPSGTRILPLLHTSVSATTATGFGGFQAVEGPTWDPAFAGRYNIVEGRGPLSSDEVMVSASALPRLGVRLGDDVTLESPALTATIVGILDDQTRPASDQVFFGTTGAFSTMPAEERLTHTEFYLPDLALDWQAVQELNRQGATAYSRAVTLEPPAAGTYALYAPRDDPFLGVLAVAGIAGLLVAFEVVLLAGAAFTVTARQQQQTLAIVSSTGAPASALVRIVSASGLVLGATGGVIGLALGIAGGTAFMALTNDGSGTQYDGYHLSWPLMIAVAAFAVLIGWIASLVPARSAARLDVVAALRGSRRPPRSGVRRPIVGLVLLALGVPVTLLGGVILVVMTGNDAVPDWVPGTMLVVGPVLAQIGVILCGPLLLRVAARVSVTGVGARLASRDAARNPGRSVPALAAILSAVFIAVVAMNLVASVQRMQENYYNWWTMPGQVEVPLRYQDSIDYTQSHTYPNSTTLAASVRNTLDVDTLRTLASVQEFGSVDADSTGLFPALSVPAVNRCPSDNNSPEWTPALDDSNTPASSALARDPRCIGYYVYGYGEADKIWVGDEADLALILGRAPSGEARRTLAAGGAVSFYMNYVDHGALTIEWWTPTQWNESRLSDPAAKGKRSATVTAVVDAPEHPIKFGIFMLPTTADRLGLVYQDSLLLASLKSEPTQAQTDSMYQSLRAVTGAGEERFLARIESGPPRSEPWIWGILAISAAIAIAAAAVAIGLARFDGRRDDATLSSLGASPLLRRNFAFWQALILTGIGTLVGAGLGLIPSLGLSGGDLPFAPPWLQLGLVVVALPLGIAGSSWLLATARSSVLKRSVID